MEIKQVKYDRRILSSHFLSKNLCCCSSFERLDLIFCERILEELQNLCWDKNNKSRFTVCLRHSPIRLRPRGILVNFSVR